MPLINSYVTVAEVREQLGDDQALRSLAQLERVINATSRAVDRYCGRRFWLDPTAATRRYRARDPRQVVVDDIGDLTGVVVEVLAGSVWQAVASSAVQFEPLNAAADGAGGARPWTRVTGTGVTFPVAADPVGALDTARAVPLTPTAGEARVRVTARFGWPSVPEDVAQATLIKAAAVASRTSAPLGVAGFDGFGPVRISRFGDPDVAAHLQPFIRIGRPDT
jgi:hypothetical protein